MRGRSRNGLILDFWVDFGSRSETALSIPWAGKKIAYQALSLGLSDGSVSAAEAIAAYRPCTNITLCESEGLCGHDSRKNRSRLVAR